MPRPKKVERGTLYLAGPGGRVVPVKPSNQIKFTDEELRHCIGGWFELMIPAIRHTTVYVNEEGAIKHLSPNDHTWTFAKREVYRMNGYRESWRVAGNAIAVHKLTIEDTALFDELGSKTVKEAVA